MMPKKPYFLFMVVIVCFCFLSMSNNPVFCIAEMTEAELLGRHSQYWGNIKKIDMQYRHTHHQFVPNEETGNVQKRDTVKKYNWLYSPSCEKWFLQESSKFPEEDGRLHVSHNYIRCGDIFIAGSQNPQRWYVKPQSVLEAVKQECFLSILPADGMIVEMQTPPGCFLNWKFTPSGVPARMVSLSESIARWTDHQLPIRSVDTNGDVLWTLRVTTPYYFDKISKDKELAKQYYTEFVFNESKNYLLHKQIYFYPAALRFTVDPETNEGIDTQSEITVLEYTEVQKGLYFPKRIAKGEGNERSKSYFVEGTPVFYQDHYDIDQISVNEHVKEDIRYEIPEHFLVYREDLPDDMEGKEKDFAAVSIWGKNNEPAVTFLTRKEFNDYVKKLEEYPIPAFSISKTRIFFIVLGLVMVFTALIMLYLKRGETK